MKPSLSRFILYIKYRTNVNKYSDTYEQKMNISTRMFRVLILFPDILFLFRPEHGFRPGEAGKPIPGEGRRRQGGEGQGLAGLRVPEGQAAGPEGNAAAPLPAAVLHIPQQGQGPGGELDTDLVAADGMERNTDQVAFRPPLQQGLGPVS